MPETETLPQNPESLVVEPDKVKLNFIAQTALDEAQTKHQLIENSFSKLIYTITTIKPLERLVTGFKSRPEISQVTAAAFLTQPDYERARKKLSPAAQTELLKALQTYSDQFNQQHISEHAHKLEQQNETLENVNGIDSLTDLPDRKGLKNTLREELPYLVRQVNHTERRHTEHTAPDWMKGGLCFMFDIDHFKSVNDDFGHKTGDRLIQLFAAAIKRHIRDEDLMIRLGGEEFLLFLADPVSTVDYDDPETQQTWIQLVQQFHQFSEIHWGNGQLNTLLTTPQVHKLTDAIQHNDLEVRDYACLKAIIGNKKFLELAAAFNEAQTADPTLPVRKTFSAGLAAYNTRDILELAKAADQSSDIFNDQLAKFYERADKSMYQAKNAGRSQLRIDELDGTSFGSGAVFFPPTPEPVDSTPASGNATPL